jgi:hypothetical protein
LDKIKFSNLAAFRTPGFLGSNGSFGFTNFNSFDQCDANGLNFAHNFRHNKSPVSLYLNSSNSPSGTHCDNGGDSFCYQNNNNVQLNNKNLDKSYNNNHNSSNNNSGEVISRENSPRENYRVDSPDKRADTCSPEETSRSFSSHRNDDIGCSSRSPLHHHNNDSLGSQSPENLSSSKSKSKQQHQQQQNQHSVSDMLDHKLQLSFLGPPLAALHSMTEMKSQNSPQTSSQNMQCATNPHGIDSILSRPTPVTSAHLNAALGGENYLFY